MKSGAAVVLAALAVVAGGCSSGHKQPHGALEWDGTPQVFAPRDLPRDRIVLGRVRNASSHTLNLVAARLVVRDAAGKPLRSSAAYTASYAHGLFGAFQQPSQLPQSEVARLGRAIYLTPAHSAPFYAAWRLTPGSREPVRIDYGGGSLSIPRDVRPAAP